MSYPLSILERMVCGDLMPCNDDPENELLFSNYLKENLRRPIKYYQVTFRKHAGEYQIINISGKYSSKYKFPANDLSLFNANNEVIALRLLKQAMIELSIEGNDVYNFVFSSFRKEITVELAVIINPDELELSEKKYLYYFISLENQLKAVLNFIEDEVYKSKSEEEVRLAINKVFVSVRHLCSILIEETGVSVTEELLKSSHDTSEFAINRIIFNALQEILQYLEKKYSSYIDPGNFISEKFFIQLKSEYENLLSEISKKLELLSVSTEIIALLTIPIAKFELKGFGAMTFREMEFCKVYFVALYKFLSLSTNCAEPFSLLTFFREINFNHLDCFMLATQHIVDQVNSLPEETEKISTLRFYLKQINQSSDLKKISYNPELPSLTEMLRGWIEEEVVYYQRSLEKNQVHDHKEVTFHPKLRSGLSVAQLAYFHRLLREVKIIDHQNQSDIFRFIAESYSTSKVIDISAESLGSKYYNAEESTRNAVKGYVIEMLNVINKG